MGGSDRPCALSCSYSSLVRPDRLPSGWLEAQQKRGAKGADLVAVTDDMRAPTVHRLEVGEGKSTLLCLGRRSVVSSDGKTILVQSIGFEWMLYTADTGNMREAKLPGVYDRAPPGLYEGGVIALLADGMAIYWGLPTTSTEKRFTKDNSPFIGQKRMPSIKAARIGGSEFVTILPYMDPRRRVQFGGKN